MSAEFPPDPITDDYNPEAWVDPTGLLSKLRTLVQSYVTYPIAQNYPITFTNIVFVTDATLTKMANTSYVYSAVNALLTAANIWTGLNTFGTLNTNAITTNTITATTLALSGTQLVTPMTSTLTYDIIPFTLANGDYTYGTSGQIGYTLIRTRSGGYLSASPVNNTFYFEISSISLTQGVWLLTGEVSSTSTNSSTTGIGFNTSNTNVGGIGFRGITRSVPGNLTVQPFVQLSTSAVYYASGAVSMRLLMGSEGYGLTPGKSYFTAVRIA